MPRSKAPASPTGSPRISIVLPNFNYRDRVPRAINSVLDQTYQDWELIVVDDCSHDGARDVIAGFAKADSRIKPMLLDEHVGYPYGMNKGLAAAQAPYLAVLHSDSWYEPQFLETLVRPLEDTSRVGLSTCNAQVHAPQGEWVLQPSSPTFNGLAGVLSHTPVAYPYQCQGMEEWDRLIVGNYLHLVCVMFRAEALRTFSTTWPHASDWKAWLDVCLEWKVAHHHATLSHFLDHHPDQLTHQYADAAHDYWEFITLIETYRGRVDRDREHLIDLSRRKWDAAYSGKVSPLPPLTPETVEICPGLHVAGSISRYGEIADAKYDLIVSAQGRELAHFGKQFVAWPISDDGTQPPSPWLGLTASYIASYVRHGCQVLVQSPRGINRAILLAGYALHQMDPDIAGDALLERMRRAKPGCLTNTRFADFLYSLPKGTP